MLKFLLTAPRFANVEATADGDNVLVAVAGLPAGTSRIRVLGYVLTFSLAGLYQVTDGAAGTPLARFQIAAGAVGLPFAYAGGLSAPAFQTEGGSSDLVMNNPAGGDVEGHLVFVPLAA